MALARVFAAASLLFCLVAGPASAAKPPGAFAAISTTLKSALGESGAPGDALLIGKNDAIFYVESAGKANLNTPVNIAAKDDPSQLALALILVDAGFMKLDDPVKKYLTLDASSPFAKASLREILRTRVQDGAPSAAASRTLTMIAEAATAHSWDALYSEWIATPLAMSATGFSKTASFSQALGAPRDGVQPAAILTTDAADYARFLAVLANGGKQGTTKVVPPAMLEQLFHAPVIGAAACQRQDAFGACGLIEADAVGLYAWVDRARGLYGVLAAPGAETSVAKSGRAIRAQAEAIFDREHAATGISAAVKRAK